MLQGRQHRRTERVGRRSSEAMRHSRNHVETDEALSVPTAHPGDRALVIIDGRKWRNQRIAPALEKDQLAASCLERRQIGVCGIEDVRQRGIAPIYVLLHGNRVLAFTPPHLRKLTAPTTVTAETLLPAAESTPVIATESSVARYRHYFRRDDLYRLVWTSPVSEIAARLGVSDVALAKLCRRAEIPVPGRGYWQRTEAGQAVEPTPLGEASTGLPELLRIRGAKPSSSMSTTPLLCEDPQTPRQMDHSLAEIRGISRQRAQ
jgi:hypothetical protein